MADIDISTGSDTEKMERFAALWWEGDTGSTQVDLAPSFGPADRASTLVIRAERV